MSFHSLYSFSEKTYVDWKMLRWLTLHVYYFWLLTFSLGKLHSESCFKSFQVKFLGKKNVFIGNVFRICDFKQHLKRLLNNKSIRNIFKISYKIKMYKYYLNFNRCPVAHTQWYSLHWSLNVIFHLKMPLNDKNDFPLYDAMRIHSFYSLKKIYINSSKLLN